MTRNSIANGIAKLSPGWAAVIINVITLIIAFTLGYQSLASDTKQLKDNQESFLRKESWEIRNKFVDEKLGRIEVKLDMLLERGTANRSTKKGGR